MGPENYYGFQQSADYPTQPAGKQRTKILLLVIGALAGLTLLLFIASNLLAPPNIRPEIAQIAAQQNEISRVAQIGLDSENSRQATRILAGNVRATSLSHVAQLNGWAQDSAGGAFTRAELESVTNDRIDEELSSARSLNDFDEVFSDAMLTLLEAANQQIIQSFDSFSEYQALQTLLNDIGSNNQLLIESISSN